MKNPIIAFIGGGNMASSLIGGLLDSGFDASQLRVSDPVSANLNAFAKQNIATSTDNLQSIRGADVVILAVKPQVLAEVCTALVPALKQQPVVISIAAGIPIKALQNWLGEAIPVIRCMPNTPALLKAGATGLYASDEVSPAQRELGETILKAVGIVEWVANEALIDAVTAVSGSGPAYFFLVMEMMEKIGCEFGLDQQTAHRLSIQTALGAAQMAANSDGDIAELRKRVTSPGGTTEKAVETFTHQGIETLFRDAMHSCLNRAQEMAAEFSHKDNT